MMPTMNESDGMCVCSLLIRHYHRNCHFSRVFVVFADVVVVVVIAAFFVAIRHHLQTVKYPNRVASLPIILA